MPRTVLFCLILFCLTAVSAGTAVAHTGLSSSSPLAGEVLSERPAQVALTFDEPVTGGEDAIRVYDDRMRRVDLGGHPGGEPSRTVRVALPGSLRAGTFSVAWQVTSADGHSPDGTFRFSLGKSGPVVGAVPPPDDSGDGWATPLRAAARGLGYAGLALGPGVLLMALWLWPAGLRDGRARGLMWTGLALLGAATLTVLLVNALGAHDHPSTGLPAALTDRAHTVRFYALSALGTATWLLTARGRASRPQALATTAVIAVLLATWPLTSHAVTGRQTALAVAADLAHLTAMTVWLGGLAVIAVALSRPATVTELGAVLPRFSRLAFTSVLVLVVTGTYQAWREGLSVPALPDTLYGRLFLLKLIGVAVVVAVAAPVRRRLHRFTPPGSPDGLRRALTAELLTGAVVLALTAVMVTTTLPG
ncbi:copper resistance CopC/CopD family protein [Streptomyces sp. NPDC087658]|uniref:copper resistance CopC/CopD family protein n=1 Tax=Streptomyces sp. NPDC087658 TaxID=3365800 RepID=UPI0037F8489C